jgi:hypothetical protein
MKRTPILFAFASLLSLLPLAAQRRNDPLNPLEIDQLRDTALDPGLRLKLLVNFARTRLDTLQTIHADPKLPNRGQETHDRLRDFLDVYDELNDNIDMYADRKDDIRKPLKEILEADNEFGAKLRALKDSRDTPAAERKQYEFLLSNAIETIDNSTQDHRQLMADQEELAKRKKKKKQ